ncbi:hypothetical protein [Burkholderia territorii]|uniref:hypothetical protein n=1 Tax=Burkholderia territorii TaxID=1503055 RepID=UPI001478843A|nr:hypothetical protein [Burkholderia territorii]
MPVDLARALILLRTVPSRTSLTRIGHFQSLVPARAACADAMRSIPARILNIGDVGAAGSIYDCRPRIAARMPPSRRRRFEDGAAMVR